MAQVTALSTLYPLMHRYLPGARDIDILEALRVTVREFCADTKAFHEWVGPVAITDWRQDYDLSDHHPYTAQIHQTRQVTVNGIAQEDDEYSLYLDRWLRWAGDSIPHDLTDTLLTCGTAGITTLAGWQAITNGSFCVPLGGDSYGVTGLNFSGADTLDDVADIIQAGIRAELESSNAFVYAICSNAARTTLARFKMAVLSSSSIDVLTAGTTGTDISGAGHLNGRTGAGTVAAHFMADVVFRPDLRTESLPYWFIDRYAGGIMAGAIGRMAAQEKKPWSNSSTANAKMGEYMAALTDATSEFAFDGHAEPLYGMEG